MRVDIFEGYDGGPTSIIEDQRERTNNAAAKKVKSEQAETEVQDIHTEETRVRIRSQRSVNDQTPKHDVSPSNM